MSNSSRPHRSTQKTAALKEVSAQSRIGAPVETPADMIYTCLVHPEVRQDHPGGCSKCGRALGSSISRVEQDGHALADFHWRFWWALPLAVVATTMSVWGYGMGWLNMAQARVRFGRQDDSAEPPEADEDVPGQGASASQHDDVAHK